MKNQAKQNPMRAIANPPPQIFSHNERSWRRVSRKCSLNKLSELRLIVNQLSEALFRKLDNRTMVCACTVFASM